ncbi:MAG TPA: twin-arginine translocase subunit TatC [Candidatus Megaira endosymbiont of Hartmannula sinica]|nr:twin-arginine translocase subunit TatC [Candidatus Megaera endosymbiont of Hartmannula sinica]
MQDKYLSLTDHIKELKGRVITILLFFTIGFFIAYYFKEDFYSILLKPLEKTGLIESMIYTDLTEAFSTYIKITSFAALLFTIPFFIWNIYYFISPGLNNEEVVVFRVVIIFIPILFMLGIFFVYFFVMPNAWEFFSSFQIKSVNNLKLATTSKLLLNVNTDQTNLVGSLSLYPKISEYVNLSINLMLSFGFLFQIPVITIILYILDIITIQTLIDKRRIVIVVIFILAAIFTPPDVLSQIILAVPLLLLYELSIIICRLVKKT